MQTLADKFNGKFTTKAEVKNAGAKFVGGNVCLYVFPDGSTGAFNGKGQPFLSHNRQINGEEYKG